jgi:Fe-Mn family superoxide dismutase
MDFALPPLPFEMDALEPHVSREQIFFHYDHHHRGYLEKLDAALKDSPKRALPLEEIVCTSQGKVYNLAAQVWNHQFLWQSFSPTRQAPPAGKLTHLLSASFGGPSGFDERFAHEAEERFGSGWAWLVYDPHADWLSVTSTDDAKNPLGTDAVPLLTLDVWEHAYYLDYKDDRKAFIHAFLEHFVNWDFANTNLERAIRAREQRKQQTRTQRRA